MNAIEIIEVTVARGEQTALAGVSLNVCEGETLGVYGHNGAGKSTLLKLLNGLVRPTVGTIRVLGREATCPNLRWIRTQTAYVPQLHPVDPRLPVSAGDVVLMGRYGLLGLGRRPGSSDADAVRRALALVGATHLAGQPFGRLSGGEQQRVLIARALAQEPRLLLLDEPTNSLDRGSQQAVCALLQEVQARRQRTVVVVSHDASLLAATCDRIATLDAGRLLADEEPAAFSRRLGAMAWAEGVPRW